MRSTLLLFGLMALPGAAAATQPEETWSPFAGVFTISERTLGPTNNTFTSQGQPLALSIGAAVHKTYMDQVPAITTSLTAALQKQSLTDIKLSLEPDIDSMTVTPSSHGIMLAAFLRKNTLHCKAASTTILFKAGDVYDLTFDAVIVVDLQVGPSTSPSGSPNAAIQPFQIDAVSARTFNVTSKTNNALVGIIGHVTVAQFFPQLLNASTEPLPQAVSSGLAYVQQAAQQGYTSMVGELAIPKSSPTNVNVFLTKTLIPNTTNNAGNTGAPPVKTQPEEYWPSSTGLFNFTLRTLAQANGGASSLGQPTPVALGAALHQTYKAQLAATTATLVADLQKLGLTDVNLALEQDIDSLTVTSSNREIQLAAFLRKNTLHCVSGPGSLLFPANQTTDLTFDAVVIINLQVGPTTSPTGSPNAAVQPFQIDGISARIFNLAAKTNTGLVSFLSHFNLSPYFSQKAFGAASAPFAQALATGLTFVQQAAQQGYTAMEGDLTTPNGPASEVNVFVSKTGP